MVQTLSPLSSEESPSRRHSLDMVKISAPQRGASPPPDVVGRTVSVRSHSSSRRASRLSFGSTSGSHSSRARAPGQQRTASTVDFKLPTSANDSSSVRIPAAPRRPSGDAAQRKASMPAFPEALDTAPASHATATAAAAVTSSKGSGSTLRRAPPPPALQSADSCWSITDNLLPKKPSANAAIAQAKKQAKANAMLQAAGLPVATAAPEMSAFPSRPPGHTTSSLWPDRGEQRSRPANAHLTAAEGQYEVLATAAVKGAPAGASQPARPAEVDPQESSAAVDVFDFLEDMYDVRSSAVAPRRSSSRQGTDRQSSDLSLTAAASARAASSVPRATTAGHHLQRAHSGLSTVDGDDEDVTSPARAPYSTLRGATSTTTAAAAASMAGAATPVASRKGTASRLQPKADVHITGFELLDKEMFDLCRQASIPSTFERAPAPPPRPSTTPPQPLSVRGTLPTAADGDGFHMPEPLVSDLSARTVPRKSTNDKLRLPAAKPKENAEESPVSSATNRVETAEEEPAPTPPTRAEVQQHDRADLPPSRCSSGSRTSRSTSRQSYDIVEQFEHLRSPATASARSASGSSTSSRSSSRSGEGSGSEGQHNDAETENSGGDVLGGSFFGSDLGEEEEEEEEGGDEAEEEGDEDVNDEDDGEPVEAAAQPAEETLAESPVSPKRAPSVSFVIKEDASVFPAVDPAQTDSRAADEKAHPTDPPQQPNVAQLQQQQQQYVARMQWEARQRHRQVITQGYQPQPNGSQQFAAASAPYLHPNGRQNSYGWAAGAGRSMSNGFMPGSNSAHNQGWMGGAPQPPEPPSMDMLTTLESEEAQPSSPHKGKSLWRQLSDAFSRSSKGTARTPGAPPSPSKAAKPSNSTREQAEHTSAERRLTPDTSSRSPKHRKKGLATVEITASAGSNHFHSGVEEDSSDGESSWGEADDRDVNSGSECRRVAPLVSQRAPTHQRRLSHSGNSLH